MSTTDLRALLARTAKTGTAPTENEIRGLLAGRMHSMGEYHDKHRRITRAARAIAGHAREGNTRMINEIAEATLIALDDTPPNVDAISRSTGYAVVNGRRPGSRDNRAAEPLWDLMRGVAGAGRPLRAADLDHLDTDLTGQQLTEFRAAVLDASREVARVGQSGEQAEARRLADRLAAELGEHLAPPAERDTDHLTAEQLAALIPRSPEARYR